MFVYEFEGVSPTIHSEASVAPTATLIGDVTVEAGASLPTSASSSSTVLDGARIGARSMVAAHSLVPAGFTAPSGVLVAGAPAKVKRELEGTAAAAWVAMNPPYYAELAQRHRKGIVPPAQQPGSRSTR